MNHTIEIVCLNTQEKKTFPPGTPLKDMAESFNVSLTYPILGALVNYKLKEMNYRVYRPKHILFFDISSPDGFRLYTRSLIFILYKALISLFPDAHLYVKHSISKGIYCELENLDQELNSSIVNQIKSEMESIVQKDIPFLRKEIETDEIIRMFNNLGLQDKARVHKHRIDLYSSVNFLDKTPCSFYSCLIPSTGFITVFDVVPYFNGFLLRLPDKNNPGILPDIVKQDKMFEIFKQHQETAKILNLSYTGNLNDCVIESKSGEIIKIAEALQEKKVAAIADLIYKGKDTLRIILIAGPSSSGKTTFAKRLSIQLRVLGLKPIQISMDNYFLDREESPRDENGDYNFENLDALDINLFNKNLLDLLAGKTIKVPKFDFHSGNKFYDGETLSISDKHILLIEGIHALNPDLIPKISDELTYKIYISALTQITIDSHNRIHTTDNRLIRRMIRDHKYRGHDALATLQRWASVRAGEDRNIFPYQENADVMFNSALLYELGVLKKYASPLLYAIKQNQPEFSEARRLLKFLSYFLPIPDDEIPPTSILREFLGGSSFKYE